MSGRIRIFDDKRIVFVAHLEERKTWRTGFRSSDGDDTKLTLSDEAMEALINMATGIMTGVAVGDEVKDFPHHVEWRLVQKEPDNA